MPNFKTKNTIYERLPSYWNQQPREIDKSLNIFKSKFKNNCFKEYEKVKCTKRHCYSCGTQK